jgi:hypothetical protein
MKTYRQLITEAKSFSKDDAHRIGDKLDVNWDKVDIEQFRIGLGVESEHDDGSELDVVGSEKDLGKIVLAHLKELPDYYTKLKQVEEEGVPANSISGGGIANIDQPLVRKKPKNESK